MQSLAQAMVAARGRGLPSVENLVDEALIDAPIDAAAAEAELAALLTRIAEAERGLADAHPEDSGVDAASLARAGSLTRPQLNALKTRATIQERRVNEAHERDRRSREQGRPAGCWCLGAGGRDPVGVARALSERPNEWAGEIDEVAVLDTTRFREYCPCPDGARVAAEHTAAMEQAIERFERDHAKQVLTAHWADVGLPPNSRHYPTLADFPRTDPRQIAVIKKLEAWRPPRWLYLHGTTRRGKTTLAAALARHADEMSYAVRFRTMDQILERLKAAIDHEGETVDDVLKPLLTVEFLVIDDLGAEAATRWAIGRILRMLDERLVNGLTTIITSNFDMGQGPTSLGHHFAMVAPDDSDFRLQATRIVARIRESADIVLVDGPALMPDQADPLPW